MQGKLKIHVQFKDSSRAPVDDEIPAVFQPGQEKAACLQLLAGINSTGGHLLFIDDGLVFTPLASIESLRITASSIVGGSLLDIAQLDQKKLVH
jgi:hypothetical protein